MLPSPPSLTADTSALYPIAMLLDEMKSEDVEARISAMRKLRIVAAALGPERTRSELVPFLSGEFVNPVSREKKPGQTRTPLSQP